MIREYIYFVDDNPNGTSGMTEEEIIRCKDCMLNTINTDGTTEPWCYKFGYAVEDTDFCSYGERIEE